MESIKEVVRLHKCMDDGAFVPIYFFTKNIVAISQSCGKGGWHTYIDTVNEVRGVPVRETPEEVLLLCGIKFVLQGNDAPGTV